MKEEKKYFRYSSENSLHLKPISYPHEQQKKNREEIKAQQTIQQVYIYDIIFYIFLTPTSLLSFVLGVEG